MGELGAYIHIPFCKQKCLYCDFASFAKKEDIQPKYMEALKKEIEYWKSQNQDAKIKTVYIGGGTPSYINSKYIVQVLKLLGEVQSVTIEINPGTVTRHKLEQYKKAGVNRLSIGLQSAKDKLLKDIGRIHNYKEFLEVYKTAREIGFENINVDLMIGLPKQTIKDVKETLQNVTNLKPQSPEHISVYSLIVEDETPMQKLVETKKIQLPEEEFERQMYWYVKSFLELQGYKHYEISNFAKPGFESRHNLDCWDQKEYIGFGVAAHSYFDNKRFSNISNLQQYIINCENEEFENNTVVQEIQTKEDKMKEYMILGLRKIDGISIQKFENNFNENPIMLFKNELQKLHKEKLIYIDGDTIKLTNKGLDLANLVWEEFV